MAAEESTEYVMGGSSAELDRIHGMHESTVRHTGKLLYAPVDFSSRLRILDSGTAAGRWLQDLRKEKGTGHEYVGTDITVSFFPPPSSEEGAIQYYAQDVQQPWPQDWQGSFDVVHQRFTLGGVGKPQLRDAVMQLIGLVRPGGWIQLSESDVSEDVVRDDGNGAVPVSRLIRELFLAMGVEPDLHKYLRGWFDEAGLVDVQDQHITVPVGAARTGEDPEMAQKSAQTIVVTAQHLAMGAKQIGKTSFSTEELDALPARVKTALAEKGGSYRIYAIWGRKPIGP